MASLTWTTSPITLAANAEDWGDLIREGLDVLANKWSAILEDYAKEHRPWTDRTNQARSGLTGRAVSDDHSVTIYLIHLARHGIYLEMRPPESGGRPIINPTMEANYADIYADLERLVG